MKREQLYEKQISRIRIKYLVLRWKIRQNAKNKAKSPPKGCLESICQSFLHSFSSSVIHCVTPIPLNLHRDFIDDFIQFSMTYPLQIAEAFRYILFDPGEQPNAKVSVTSISEKNYCRIMLSYFL
jgi:hypothetical protein